MNNLINPLDIGDRAVAILFCRWMATNYSEVLNKTDGHWYAQQLEFFLKNVLPNYIDNGSYRDHKAVVNRVLKENDMLKQDLDEYAEPINNGKEIEIIL